MNNITSSFSYSTGSGSRFVAWPPRSSVSTYSSSCTCRATWFHPVFFVFTVKERMVGTKNIEKITKSMKMVSAAKLRGDQNRLSAAVPFAVRSTRVYLDIIFG